MVDFFPVHADGRQVGRVTSACHSPRLEKNIGFAMLPIEFEELGTPLEVDTPSGRWKAVVVEKPFVDPTKEIPKG
jgi:glycine cleavage system aminomethyltransferase T